MGFFRLLLFVSVVWAEAAMNKLDYHYCFGAADPAKVMHIPPIPPHYELVSVQAVIRHGARAPLSNLGDLNWACKEDEMVDYDLLTNNKVPQVHRHFRIQKLGAKTCFLGQLTTLGVTQGEEIGRAFREAYVDRTHLLSPTLNRSQLSIRATDYVRVQQTAEAVVRGMFPSPQRRSSHVVEIGVKESEQEDMRANSALCPSIHSDMAKILHSQAYEDLISKSQTSLLILDKAFEKSENATHPSFTAKHLEPAQGWDLRMDTLREMSCHNKTIPPTITDAVREVLYRVDDFVWSHVDNGSYAVKALGKFATQTIGRNFARTVDKGDPVKFRLFAGHDVTVAPLLALFNVFDGHPPPLASQVLFELLRMHGKNEHAVRVVYNSKPLQPKVCNSTADYLCTWEQWTKLINNLEVLTKEEYKSCYNVPLTGAALIKHLNHQIVFLEAGTTISVICLLTLLVVVWWKCDMCYSRKESERSQDAQEDA